MIRFRRVPLDLLNAWLVHQRLDSAPGRYRLRLWRENRAELPAVRAALIAYVEEGLEDARKRLRRGFEDDLSPFLDDPNDPAARYPGILNRITLQGYFGETLAALAVEHWGAHGIDDWVVPAFLFRFHNQEFQHLDAMGSLSGECS